MEGVREQHTPRRIYSSIKETHLLIGEYRLGEISFFGSAQGGGGGLTAVWTSSLIGTDMTISVELRGVLFIGLEQGTSVVDGRLLCEHG